MNILETKLTDSDKQRLPRVFLWIPQYLDWVIDQNWLICHDLILFESFVFYINPELEEAQTFSINQGSIFSGISNPNI